MAPASSVRRCARKPSGRGSGRASSIRPPRARCAAVPRIRHRRGRSRRAPAGQVRTCVRSGPRRLHRTRLHRSRREPASGWGAPRATPLVERTLAPARRARPSRRRCPGSGCPHHCCLDGRRERWPPPSVRVSRSGRFGARPHPGRRGRRSTPPPPSRARVSRSSPSTSARRSRRPWCQAPETETPSRAPPRRLPPLSRRTRARVRGGARLQLPRARTRARASPERARAS